MRKLGESITPVVPTSKAALDGQVRKKCKLHKAGERILPAKYGFDVKVP
jgi:hypothetical protein